MVAFALIVLITLGAALVAMLLRNLIHSALLLIGSWAGIAAFYLWAGAEFLAFAQVLVYLGAVSMIVLFAVLLTRHADSDFLLGEESVGRVVAGLVVGGAVLGVLTGAVLSSPLPARTLSAAPTLTVREIGQQLMGPHAAALLIVGILLTVALLGAVVIAATDKPAERGNPEKPQ